jgi:transposase
MPRRPAQDYEDRCRAVGLEQEGRSRREIARVLQRPGRWVRRTLQRYDEQVGLESLRDHSLRPHHSSHRAPPMIEQVICGLKQAHPSWGRRQISKQLHWQWRDDQTRRAWVSEGWVRCVLRTHPELSPPPTVTDRPPPRQIDYVACNLVWGADTHQTRLPDGSV